jgi:hypothetical protein
MVNRRKIQQIEFHCGKCGADRAAARVATRPWDRLKKAVPAHLDDGELLKRHLDGLDQTVRKA